MYSQSVVAYCICDSNCPITESVFSQVAYSVQSLRHSNSSVCGGRSDLHLCCILHNSQCFQGCCMLDEVSG